MQATQTGDRFSPTPGCTQAWTGRWRLAGLLSAGLLQGCAFAPHWDTVHDGLRTSVVDAATHAPLARAFAYGKVDASGRATVLAYSDAMGKLRLEPQRTLRFFRGPAEKAAPLGIVICKEGYAPQVVVDQAALSAEGSPPRKVEVARVALARSSASALPAGPADAPLVVAAPARCEAGASRE